jgi:RNA polymerase sigma factor (sigma-70 family)
MASRPVNTTLRQLRKVLGAPGGSQLSDEQLLRRFLEVREEAAFAALVERHGPMVLGVCRSVLQHTQDAEDACQATFLVLARKAASIDKQGSVASWLHGVAYRLALKSHAARRRTPPGHAGQPPCHSPVEELSWREVQQVLHDELERLPGKYRLPLILCYLQAHTQEEAAHLLGWTAGSLKGRLDRGRDLLRRRLTRRGLAALLPLGVAALAPEVPAATRVDATARAAVAFLHGQSLGADVPTGAAALARQGLRAVPLARSRAALALLLVFGVLAAGAGLAAYRAALADLLAAAPQNEPHAQAPVKEKEEAKKQQKVRGDLYGDPLPPGAVARIGTSRLVLSRGQYHTSPLAYTPDGKQLVSCEAGKLIRFWDAATGKELLRIEAADGTIDDFVLAPDGKTVAAFSLNSPMIWLWDSASGKLLLQLPVGKEGIYAAAFSPDGKTFAATVGEGVRLWDTGTWQTKGQLPAGPTTSLVFVPQSSTLITAGDGIRWWNLDTGKEVRRLPEKCRWYNRLNVSGDGQWLAAIVEPGMLQIWKAAGGEVVSRTVLGPGRDGLLCLCFSPDGKTLACSGEDWQDGKRKAETLFLAADTGKPLYRWDRDVAAHRMVFSPDGKVLAQVAGNAVRLRDAKTGKPAVEVPRLPHYVMSVGFEPDSKTLLTGCFGGQFARWDPLSGKQLAPVQAPPAAFAGPAEMLLGAALTPDGKKAALVDDRGVLHVWDPATGKAACMIDNPPVGEDQAAFSPSGTLLVVKHRDNIIRLWEAATGKLRCALPRYGETRFPHAHAFSADSKVLATAPSSLDEPSIRLWDTVTGKLQGKLTWADQTEPTCLAFSPDGKYLVSAHGSRGKEEAAAAADIGLRLWDLAAGREVRRLPVACGDIRSMVWSPDSRTVAVAAYDIVVLWETATGKERGRFTGHQAWVWSLALSPDGRLLASGSQDYTALLWDLTGVCPDGKLVARDLRDEEVKALWKDLAGADGVKAHRALWTMVAGARQTLPFLAKHLQPVAPAADERLARLLEELNSTKFAVRAQATKELQQLGDLAAPAMEKVLASQPSLEVRLRLEGLLNELATRPLSGEQARMVRATEILEHIATAEARQVLEALAGGAPGALQTRQAKASLGRLSGPSQDP